MPFLKKNEGKTETDSRESRKTETWLTWLEYIGFYLKAEKHAVCHFGIWWVQL